MPVRCRMYFNIHIKYRTTNIKTRYQFIASRLSLYRLDKSDTQVTKRLQNTYCINAFFS